MGRLGGPCGVCVFRPAPLPPLWCRHSARSALHLLLTEDSEGHRRVPAVSALGTAVNRRLFVGRGTSRTLWSETHSARWGPEPTAPSAISAPTRLPERSPPTVSLQCRGFSGKLPTLSQVRWGWAARSGAVSAPTHRPCDGDVRSARPRIP